MKKRIITLIILLSVVLTSCRHQTTYAFLNSVDDVSSISIVSLSFDQDGKMIENEINKIQNVTAFLNDFQSIGCYEYYGDPIGATPEGIEDDVIKILYKNGEYELVNWNGQSKYTNEKKFVYYSGFKVFDEKQFESLLDKYMSA